MVKLKAKIKGDNAVISQDSFEHLLNCLDHQKFIHDVNADALECDDYEKVQKDNQDAIDDFGRQCRVLLHGLSDRRQCGQFRTT